MAQFNIDDLGALASQFAASEFGKWYLAELEKMEKSQLDTAKSADAHNITQNAVMRADGLSRARKTIQDKVDYHQAKPKLKSK